MLEDKKNSNSSGTMETTDQVARDADNSRLVIIFFVFNFAQSLNNHELVTSKFQVLSLS